MESTEQRTYTVEGMSCGHCMMSVREEVSELTGVVDVDVDLPAGRLTVVGQDISDDAVRTAVEDAGYRVAA